MLLKPDRVDSDELLEELETASNKERFSYVGILPCSAEMENCVMRGNRMVVNYLKALPSVMAWIFLSSATMSSISCNSYMGLKKTFLLPPFPLRLLSFAASPTPS